jgi:hypothetical protein
MVSDTHHRPPLRWFTLERVLATDARGALWLAHERRWKNLNLQSHPMQLRVAATVLAAAACWLCSNASVYDKTLVHVFAAAPPTTATAPDPPPGGGCYLDLKPSALRQLPHVLCWIHGPNATACADLSRELCGEMCRTAGFALAGVEVRAYFSLRLPPHPPPPPSLDG